MASEDYTRIRKLFWSGEKVTNVEVVFEAERATATVKFSTDDGPVTIRSEAPDAALLAMSFKLSDFGESGEDRLVPVQDTEHHYTRVQSLIDEDGTALHEAADRIEAGEATFTEVPRDLIEEFVTTHKVGAHRFLPLRDSYFEIACLLIAERRQLTDQLAKLESTRPQVREIADATEDALDAAFRSEASPPLNYRLFVRRTDVDLKEIYRRLSMDREYEADLIEMLTEGGKVQGRVGVLYVLDLYRRFSEICAPVVNALRIAVELTKGNPEPEDRVRYPENCSVVRDALSPNPLGSLDPYVRIAESHRKTRVDMTQPKEVIVPTDDGAPPHRYSLEEVRQRYSDLSREIVPGLVLGYALFETKTLGELVDSFEYKSTLLRIGNQDTE